MDNIDSDNLAIYDNISNIEILRPDTEIFLTEDNINHPRHYTQHPSGIECIEITQHYNFCIGNAIKYLWRNGLKSNNNLDLKESKVQDLKKAIWYINKEISNIENNVYE